MKATSVNIAEGKKGFSRLVRDSSTKKEEYIITKRGKPMVAIIPYEEYLQSKKIESHRKIMAARQSFLKSGIPAKGIFEESRRQLEEKG